MDWQAYLYIFLTILETAALVGCAGLVGWAAYQVGYYHQERRLR